MAVKTKGRPSLFSDTQLEEIKQVVSSDPENYGYHMWDGPTLSDYIKVKYNIEYGIRACQKLFHRFALRSIRPSRPRITKLATRLKKQQNMNENPDIIPAFQDEVHFQAKTSITRVWAPKGSEPKVMSKPGKNNIAYSGFVIPATGELYVTKPGWFNYESVIQSFHDFIRFNPAPEGKKYCIILDNAPWHKKAIRLIWKEAWDEYADIRGAMEYLLLPPYSPELNPIEQVWRKTRREKTHNRYFPSLSILTETPDEYFLAFVHPNEQLKSLCVFSCFQVV